MRSTSAGSRTLCGSCEARDPREDRVMARVGAVAELIAQAQIELVGGGHWATGTGRIETEAAEAGRRALHRARLDARPAGAQVGDSDQDDLRPRQVLHFLGGHRLRG